MIGRIKKLSEDVINQIAAGEVVENPASVIKELVENSLDAGAKRIAITTQQGGFEKIRIEDDGCGMSRDDALMSLERHATSKIQNGDDLLKLLTMGFRGEALAAIAAISHLDMKTSEDQEGTHIKASGGKIGLVEPIARNRGTTIEIQSLFYNVPARRKFQKSIAASSAYIHRTVETIALAHPEICLSLHSDEKLVLEVEPQNQKERIEALLGNFEHMGSDAAMWGLFGTPHESKTHRRNQFLFVNRRPIFSPLVSRAIKEGYGTRIKENEHPRFILFLELPPDQVDVNVHPQKKEARFSHEETLFRNVRQLTVSVFERQIENSFTEPLSFTSPPTAWILQEESLPEKPVKSEPLFMPIAFPEKILGIFDHYLLIEREALLLIDLQAAVRRIAFEEGSSRQSSSHYTLEEAKGIWKQLQKCRDLRYDPAGNLIWKEMGQKDWERILN